MIFRRHDNPFPFAREILAASRAALTRGEARDLSYGLTTVARHLDTALADLRRDGTIRRGVMASRLDVMIGDLSRQYQSLMSAEQADRAKREREEAP